MSSQRPHPSSFRRRFLAGELLLGTFIKTPTSHATEILGEIGFDFVVIDEEHAPFDRLAIDMALLAARAAGTAGIVRVARADPRNPLGARQRRDRRAGAACRERAKAREIVAACRYRGGRRGYSGSPRAAGYGATPMWKHVERRRRGDRHRHDRGSGSARRDRRHRAVEGLDGVFIGRGDLTVALGAASNDAAAVQRGGRAHARQPCARSASRSA